MIEDKLKILFLCTGNACRSQMAEGWVNHLKSDQIDKKNNFPIQDIVRSESANE